MAYKPTCTGSPLHIVECCPDSLYRLLGVHMPYIQTPLKQWSGQGARREERRTMVHCGWHLMPALELHGAQAAPRRGRRRRRLLCRMSHKRL